MADLDSEPRGLVLAYRFLIWENNKIGGESLNQHKYEGPEHKRGLSIHFSISLPFNHQTSASQTDRARRGYLKGFSPLSFFTNITVFSSPRKVRWPLPNLG